MTLRLKDLIKCGYYLSDDDIYDIIIKAGPAIGILYTTKNSPNYLSGQVRLTGRNNGRYPYNCLEMIEHLFGPEDNTIEVCSYNSHYLEADITTVDINPANNPSIVDDGQVLSKVKDNSFNRW